MRKTERPEQESESIIHHPAFVSERIASDHDVTEPRPVGVGVEEKQNEVFNFYVSDSVFSYALHLSGPNTDSRHFGGYCYFWGGGPIRTDCS